MIIKMMPYNNFKEKINITRKYVGGEMIKTIYLIKDEKDFTSLREKLRIENPRRDLRTLDDYDYTPEYKYIVVGKEGGLEGAFSVNKRYFKGVFLDNPEADPFIFIHYRAEED